MDKLTPPPLTLLDKYHGPEFQGLYTAQIRVTGGEAAHGRASGVIRSDDGNLELDLRLPEALGGPGGGTNPEQLFAAGYAACFHGALMLIAAKNGIELGEVAVDAAVTFGRDPVDGMYMLTADISIHLPGVERAIAEQLVRSTERVCPYAKMAREGIASVISLHVDVPAADGGVAK
ncbi:Ohr family peroxiredoxin [Paraburkholderia rhizosphaerae]|uniref:Ohr subfamily peroxiredoxin n=1 Tax=Paraburkholderia rhizosphaerae TaxID=480658 RepID=A0A4R8LVD1_9BURK|nr:Ohr family peroxiredoxin [Paraburkholderia rhizosphaerae]TDY50785.1 Ohr subfamily peroxiredoxin [Paraburkholderia rhizosphaerae]